MLINIHTNQNVRTESGTYLFFRLIDVNLDTFKYEFEDFKRVKTAESVLIPTRDYNIITTLYGFGLWVADPLRVFLLQDLLFALFRRSFYYSIVINHCSLDN